MTKEEATQKAKKDLGNRLGLGAGDVTEGSITEVDFPDMALGAGTSGEMSGQMLTRGWKIELKAGGKSYEYRADKNQLRLFKFKGKNYKI